MVIVVRRILDGDFLVKPAVLHKHVAEHVLPMFVVDL
jgi:hypothetical protein